MSSTVFCAMGKLSEKVSKPSVLKIVTASCSCLLNALIFPFLISRRRSWVLEDGPLDLLEPGA